MNYATVRTAFVVYYIIQRSRRSVRIGLGGQLQWRIPDLGRPRCPRTNPGFTGELGFDINSSSISRLSPTSPFKGM